MKRAKPAKVRDEESEVREWLENDQRTRVRDEELSENARGRKVNRDKDVCNSRH